MFKHNTVEISNSKKEQQTWRIEFTRQTRARALWRRSNACRCNLSEVGTICYVVRYGSAAITVIFNIRISQVFLGFIRSMRLCVSTLVRNSYIMKFLKRCNLLPAYLPLIICLVGRNFLPSLFLFVNFFQT